jgi:hypothetical protein
VSRLGVLQRRPEKYIEHRQQQGKTGGSGKDDDKKCIHSANLQFVIVDDSHLPQTMLSERQREAM